MAKKKIQAEIEERDGGYFFPQFDIHVVAKDEATARKLVKKYHGFDPDEQAATIVDAEKTAKR